MSNPGVFNKVGSILLIVFLILSGVLVIIPLTQITPDAEAASIWKESSDTDFKKGQMNNIEIEGTGLSAELKLKANLGGNWIEKPKGDTPDSRRGHVLSSIYDTDKALLYGGYKGGIYYDDTWIYDYGDDTWTNMKPSTKPSGMHSHAMAPIHGTDKVLLFGGYISKTTHNSKTWIYDLSENKWIDKNPTGNKPVTRSYHAMASVYNDDKVLLFGGYNKNSNKYYNDTWTYDLGNNNWTNKSPSNAPSPRKGHEMANVYETSEIVLFGGNETGTKFVNDTWVYNLTTNTWSKKTISGFIPSARRGHGMAAIHGTKKVMIFGPDDQTWIYNSKTNTWSKKSPAAKPKGRYITHGIVPIYGKDKAILFSGSSTGGSLVHFTDTWVFDLSDNNWTDKTSSSKPKPSARRGHVLASIHGTDKVLLYGGWDGSYLNDTWVYDIGDNKWTAMKTPKVPGGRHSHAMASIYGDDKVVMFGGYKLSGANAETWVYDLSTNNWIKKAPSTKPSAREYHAMASVDNDDKVVLFSGYNGSGYVNDTWVYDLSTGTWTKKSPATAPSARKGHEMANVWGTKNIVLFGGNESGSKVLGDTWIYNLTADTWTKKLPATKPSARRGHGMAPIYGTDLILLFGQDDQTWLYDYSNNTWTKKSPATKPIARYITHGIAPVYDTDNAVLFGGGTSSGDLDDTWVYDTLKYPKNGTYTSNAFDTGGNSSFNILAWNSITPSGTNIKLQLRTAASNTGLTLKNFVGSNGSTSKYYTSSPVSIWSGHNKDRWIQYKVYFETNSEDHTPFLKDVSINYSNLQKPNALSPPNNGVFNSNTPTFRWENSYRSIEQQTAFSLIISSDISFKNVEFDSGEQLTQDPFWEFPMGTNYDIIPDGTWYWKVKIRDSNNNWGYNSEPSSFTIDTILPTSTINKPIENKYYTDLDIITGTASDSKYGTGLVGIEVSIKRLSDNKYWGGSKWSSTMTWLLAEGTTIWSYDVSEVQWSSGTKYNIEAKAIDMAGNYEADEKGMDIFIDFDSPVSTIKTPMNDVWVNGLFLISGNAIDIGGSGIDQVDISVKCVNENIFWNGKGWGANEYWLIVEGIDSWTLEPSKIDWYMDSPYLIRSRATDVAGNIEIAKEGNSFTIDDKPPEASIIINNGDKYTTSTSMVLSIQAEDSGSGVEQMAISYIDNDKWSDWETFDNTKDLNVVEGDGEKIIYLKLQDKVGNIAEPVSDTIILDATSPHSLSILINEGSTQTDVPEITLNLAAIDELSDVDQMSFSTDGEMWSPWENFEQTKEFNLPDSDGEKTVYFRVKDNAGNIAEPVVASIILQKTEMVIDTDKDGYPDNIDAFPTDPAAAVDTDLDGYPDYWNPGMTEKNSTTGLTLDEYPLDKELHEEPKDVEKTGFYIFPVIIAIFIIIVLLLLTSIIFRKKRDRENRQASDEEIIGSLKTEVIHGENVDDIEMSKNDLKTLYQDNYKPGELSKDTTEFIENIIDESD